MPTQTAYLVSLWTMASTVKVAEEVPESFEARTVKE